MKNKNGKSKRLFTFLLLFALTVSGLWGGGLSGAWSAGEANAEGEKDYGVANPRVAYCAENKSLQAVTYDIIEFGSYPQSEITGAKITAAIKNAAYDKNGDAEVNGVKYRRVTKEDATYVHTYNWDADSYYNWNSGGDENGYHYFKYEPIRWRVLKVDGEEALLLSETALDDKRYNDSGKGCTWEGCTMRSWLNGYASAANGDGTDFTGKNFTGSAFTEAEEAAIVPTTLTNADNQISGTEGGNDTSDKVFLLSLSDIRNADYGFVNDYNTFDEARRVKASTYARAMGAYTYSGGDYDGNCNWWLRSPGYYADYAASVWNDGHVSDYGYSVGINSHGCCPALYLNLSSSDTWKKAVEFKRGDVDHDGNLTPDDALQILMKLVGKTSPKYHEDTAECDEKAGISPDDALQILMKLAGKPSKIDKYWTENK